MRPGVRRKITVADLAAPYDTPSANNFPRVVQRPEGAWPKAPEGFTVTQFASGLIEPRVIVRAPNGDIFVAESRAGRLRVLRDADGDGKPEVNEVFTTRLERPFGIAFYPPGPNLSSCMSAIPARWFALPTTMAIPRARGQAELIVSNIPDRPRAGWRRRALDPRPAILCRRQDACTSRSARGRMSDDDAAENRRADDPRIRS